MKYSYTTAIKATTFIFLFVFFGAEIFAQKNTDSPYSRYGIGLKNSTNFNGNFALGGTGIAWRPSQYKPVIYDSLARSNAQLNDRGTNYINPSNPASFSNFSLTTFEASIVSRNVSYISNGQSRDGSNTQLGYMALGFPIGEQAGTSFGIRPYSFVGYDYSFPTVVNDISIDNSFEGSGGVNEIYFGFGYSFLQNFSAGITGNYYFGEILDQRRATYNSADNFFNTLDERVTRVSALTAKIGLQYFEDLKNNHKLIVGFVASPVDGLESEQSRIVRNYSGAASTESFRDTALYFADRNFTIANAPEYGLGVSYEKKFKWMITADFKTQLWNDVEIEEGIFLKTNQQVSIGYDRYVNLNSIGSYWSRMGYRGGLRYNSSVVNINNEDVSEFGISFGFAMPLRKSFSTINVGGEVGQRGKDSNGLTKENFFTFQIGVTINDKWFIKRKYD